MRRTTLMIAIAVVATATVGAANEAGFIVSHERTRMSPMDRAVDRLQQEYSAAELEAGVYVGSEFCLACHSGQTHWKETDHSRFIRRPMEEYSLVPEMGVIADYDGNGVDDFQQGLNFNEIESAFDAYKPNAPILGFDAGTYTVTIGELTMPVVFTMASQHYMVRVPVTDRESGWSAGNYFAPMGYSPSRGWYPDAPESWYDGTGAPRFGADVGSAELAVIQDGNYNLTCAGCHTTGVRKIEQTTAGEWAYRPYTAVLYSASDPDYFDLDGDGQFDLTNIGCESCHGPGSAHILGGPDPEEIINPAEVDAQLANDTCGRCHTRPRSVPNGTFSWPYNDATMTDWYPGVGQPLADFMTDDSVYWPDGKHGRITRPYTDFYKSSKPTFQFHQVVCFECHAVHENPQAGQILDQIVDGGVTIATAVDDNTLCLACHATHGAFEEITVEQVAEYDENLDHIADVVSAHANHPYAPERMMGLSRCVECHMPVTSGFGQLSTPSHTFEPIPPEKTLMYQDQGGMPNACAISCHSWRVDIFDIGIDPNRDNTVWDDPFDVELSQRLEAYYGPDGVWWDTEEGGDDDGEGEATMMRRVMDQAAAPGEVETPAVAHD